MFVLLLIAIGLVLTLGVFHKKVPMFGDAPFGSAPPPPQRLDAIPVVPAPAPQPKSH